MNQEKFPEDSSFIRMEKEAQQALLCFLRAVAHTFYDAFPDIPGEGMRRQIALDLLDSRFHQELDEAKLELPNVAKAGEDLRKVWVEIFYPAGTVIPNESAAEEGNI